MSKSQLFLKDGADWRPATPGDFAGGGGGGGGSTSDREFVVTTYRCKTGFTGASVGDVITSTQVINVSTGTPATETVLWRNQTTAADLSGTPSAANLETVGAAALTDAQLRASAVPFSAASLPLPTGAATAANQATEIAALASLVTQTDGVEASLASIDGKLTGVATAANQATGNSSLSSINTKTPALGSAAMTGASPVTMATDDPLGLAVGQKADAAATTDAGTFSLLALIKRGLANWTTLLATIVSGRLSAEPLGTVGQARQQPATVSSQSVTLTATVRRISIYARTSNLRYVIGTGAQTASATTSHWIASGERLDLQVPANAVLAVIRDTAATVDGTLEITELS